MIARRTHRKGNFFTVLLLNILLNLDGSIPAIILLILHFTVSFPLWPVFLAAGLWLGGIILHMLIFGWFFSQDSDLPQKSQRVNNPYSKKGTVYRADKVMNTNPHCNEHGKNN